MLHYEWRAFPLNWTKHCRLSFPVRWGNSIRESRHKIWKNRSATNYVSAVAPRIASNHFRFFLFNSRPWKIEWPFPCDWKKKYADFPSQHPWSWLVKVVHRWDYFFFKKKRERDIIITWRCVLFPEEIAASRQFHWLWSVVYCRKLRLFVGQISKWWWTAAAVAIPWEKNFWPYVGWKRKRTISFSSTASRAAIDHVLY